MAMPTRSARLTGFGEKAPTPVTIGPGSYLGTKETSTTRPSLAAFASSEPRSWQGKAPIVMSPGPGSYSNPTRAVINENEYRHSYCFESKAPRLAPQFTGSTPFVPSTAVEVPGPGAYEADKAPRLYSQREMNRFWLQHRTVPILPRRFNPPSVPRRDQCFGYNVDSQGQLLALPAPISTRAGDRFDSAGPGDYNPQEKGWWAGVGGAIFRKGERKTVFDEEWATKDVQPGPGAYNPKLRPRYHLEMPGSSAFMSEVPRGADVRCSSGPGPGQYFQRNLLDSSISSTSNNSHLGSARQRGVWLRSEECPFNEPETRQVPGPGAYVGLHDNSSFKKPVSRSLTDEKIGFGSTGRRANPETSWHTQEIPGPGEYDLNVQTITGELKHRSRIGCKGVFGSSGDRFRRSSGIETRVETRPTQLWDQGKMLKRVVVMRRMPQLTSSFKSETKRFRATINRSRGRCSSGHTKPSSSTLYTPKDSFDDILKKCTKSKSKSFLSTSQRFEGGVFDLKKDIDGPGPGAYNVTVVKPAQPPARTRSQPKPTLPQSARFCDIAEAEKFTVGPGSHDVAGSLIKQTFNVTFGGKCVSAGIGRVAQGTFHTRKPSDGTDFPGGVGFAPGWANSGIRNPSTTLEDSLHSQRVAAEQAPV